MKLFNLIIFCSAIFLFSSCSNDDSETIVGTWILTDFEVLPGCDEPEIDNIVVQNGCLMAEGESSCISFNIMENGIAQVITTFDNESETINLSYTFNEGTNMISLCDGSDCNNLTLSGDELSLNAEEDGCEVIYIFEKN